MVSWNPMEINSPFDQIIPTKSKVEIGSFRPVAGLEQSHLAGIRTRLITMKSRMHDGVGIVHLPRPRVASLIGCEQPQSSLHLPTSFLKPRQKIGGTFLDVGMNKVGQV